MRAGCPDTRLFTVMLRSSTAAVLKHLLDPAVPYVWIRKHHPHPRIEWWKTDVQLSDAGRLHRLEVKCMEFDILLETQRFLDLLADFEPHGLELHQMSRRIPSSLTLSGLTDEAQTRVLINNGLHLSFFLPHAIEDAQLASPHREVVETALGKPHIKAIAYGTNFPLLN